MDVSKNGVKPPNWMVKSQKLMEKTLLEWMIWGAHPYFWKHPYGHEFLLGIKRATLAHFV